MRACGLVWVELAPVGSLTIFARIVRIFGGESLVLGGWDVCAPLRERRRGGFIKGAGQ